ncbi:MAG: MerR family transcriptional regulator [Deltaproteobacteria bacterium]|nr:MerR family transcriptional regulator [Deltaproteobacteria bacterium]
MRTDFSTLDIVKALGIPRERLREWMNRGFVKPTIDAKGQGTKATFTVEDIYLVALFRHLVDKGIKRFNAGIYLSENIVAGTKSFFDSNFIMIMDRSDGSLLIARESIKGLYDFLAPFLSSDDGDIEHIIIVNFKKIRKIVDEALKGI